MKKLLPLGRSLLTAPSLLAAEAPVPPTWHAQTLFQAVGNMLIFAALGIIAAIIAAAVILGVSIIIAAAMIG